MIRFVALGMVATRRIDCENYRKENVEDIMIGSGFLGSGGGGSPAQGKMLVDYVLSISEDVLLADPEEIDPGAWVAVVGGMGSPAAALEKGIFNAPTRPLKPWNRPWA